MQVIKKLTDFQGQDGPASNPLNGRQAVKIVMRPAAEVDMTRANPI
jgi:hypothetical protein